MLIRSRRSAHEVVADERVEALLAAAAAPAEAGPMPGEAAACAAFREADKPASRRSRVLSSVVSFKAAAIAAATTGVLLTGGVAAAATGMLPGPAQDAARDALSVVGITVPGANGSAAQRLEDATGRAGSDAAETGGDAGKGGQIADMATDTSSTGVEKGAEISDTASGGMSQAGDSGSAPGGDATADATPGAPVEPPADLPTQADERIPDDTGSQADDASGAGQDASDAGSDNRP
jgi:hypothetical protein